MIATTFCTHYVAYKADLEKMKNAQKRRKWRKRTTENKLKKNTKEQEQNVKNKHRKSMKNLENKQNTAIETKYNTEKVNEHIKQRKCMPQPSVRTMLHKK